MHEFYRYFPFKTTAPIPLRDPSQLTKYLLCPKFEKAQATRPIFPSVVRMGLGLTCPSMPTTCFSIAHPHVQPQSGPIWSPEIYLLPPMRTVNTHHWILQAVLVHFKQWQALHFTLLTTPRSLSQMASRLVSLLDLDIFHNWFNASNNLPLCFDLAFYSHLKTWT